ncbi:glycerate kinase [Chitinasiproducens palmae]|uniref:Glycerate kinase n=1 Tax=Chitinasiproducens palmae TaxID=1770053 RepID=A0A1H2PK81_9BURK|nr:glycerate kinase [Chitinasiproducens palmae]SDV46756.1 glycerate kinase [Chitinasiproducens palmae]
MTAPARSPVVVVAPDSFKGSLDAEGVANAIADGVRTACPHVAVRLLPMADGGEGTLDALLAAGGVRRALDVSGASGARCRAALGMLDNGAAVIESAQIVGITDPVGMAAPVAERSTRGVGEAIRASLDAGAQTIYLALGGSSTNDGGAGMLVALGAILSDADGRPLEPAPAALSRAARLDLSGLDPRLASVELVGLSDVDNPLLGPHGASAVFGPQKGVGAAQVEAFDAALAGFANCAEAAFGAPGTRERAGAGAAGGLGFALHLLNARFEPGAEVVAREIGLDAALADADWMITGEGRSDAQTLRGKAPFVAARHARDAGVPVSLLSGGIDRAALPLLSEHFDGCFSPAPGPLSLDEAIRDAASLLRDAGRQLALLRFARSRTR